MTEPRCVSCQKPATTHCDWTYPADHMHCGAPLCNTCIHTASGEHVDVSAYISEPDPDLNVRPLRVWAATAQITEEFYRRTDHAMFERSVAADAKRMLEAEGYVAYGEPQTRTQVHPIPRIPEGGGDPMYAVVIAEWRCYKP